MRRSLVATAVIALALAVTAALVRDSGQARTAYYVFDGRLWGFGLFRRGASPCR